MFYFLSKTIDFLVMPLSICILLMLYSLGAKQAKRKRLAVTVATVILFVITNTYLVNRALIWWEPEPRNISDVSGVYEVGVVLSGGLISVPGLSTDHVELGSHANRFYNAYLLYKSGKIKKIFITGTSSESWLEAGKGETRQAVRALIGWGVPQKDILFEERARNTRENAVFSAKILSSHFPGKKILLITSAFHMKRAAACFAKAGVNADHFPSDFYGVEELNLVKDIFIPSPHAPGYLDLLWHEWIGYLIYKIVGYC